MITHSNRNPRIYLIFIWHGLFLAVTMAMLDFNTVLPALISGLSHSKIIFGLIYAVLLAAPGIFNLFFSHFLQFQSRKKPFLLTGIYLRAFSFLMMAASTYYLGLRNPDLAVASFFLWIFIFAVSGGFAGLAYGDIIGKTIPGEFRGKLYAARELAGSIAALAGSLIVSHVFSPGRLGFPLNYTVLFLIGCGGLILASGGFWFIDEPLTPVELNSKKSFGALIREVPRRLKGDREFSRFILVENLTSFSLMVLPFYMIFAKDVLRAPPSYVGHYLMFSVLGTIISNFLWGKIAQSRGSKAVVRGCILMGSLIPLLALFLASFGPGWFAVVFLLVGFIQSGREVGFEPYLLDIAPDAERTVYLGIRGTLSLLVVILPVLGGFFIDKFGYYFTFILVAIVMWGAFFLLRKRN